MRNSEDLELVEAEEDVRQLEQHVADQRIRIKIFRRQVARMMK